MSRGSDTKQEPGLTGGQGRLNHGHRTPPSETDEDVGPQLLRIRRLRPNSEDAGTPNRRWPVPLLRVKISSIVIDQPGSNWPMFLTWMRDEGFAFEAKFARERLHIHHGQIYHPFQTCASLHLTEANFIPYPLSLQEDREVKVVIRDIPNRTYFDMISSALLGHGLTPNHLQPLERHRGDSKLIFFLGSVLLADFTPCHEMLQCYRC